MIVSKIAPGIPRILTKIIVKKLSPIWKLKKPPIRFISSIKPAPMNEFNISFTMNFSGTMKILHSTNMMHRPEI